MAQPIEEVSDHKLIKLVVGADVRHKRDATQWQAHDAAQLRMPVTK